MNTQVTGSEVRVKTDCPVRRKSKQASKLLSLLSKPALFVQWSSQNEWSEHWPDSGPMPQPTVNRAMSGESLQGSGPAVCLARNHFSAGAICPSKSHESLTQLPKSNDLQEPPEVADPSYPEGHLLPPIAQNKEQ